VAAALALVLSEDPRLLPEEAADRIRAHAIDLSPAWTAPTAGHARLPAPGANEGSGCAGRAALALPLLLLARRRAVGSRADELR
jgi:hypothetical protein